MYSFVALTSILLTAAAPAFSKDKATPAATVPQTSKSFSIVAKKAIPAVVFIKVTGATDEDGSAIEGYQNPFDFFGDDFFNKFFGASPRGKVPKQPQLSQGSGFIVSPNGHIMTNAHVIKGADKITVILNSGKEMDATLVGMDSHTDIAIIKIEGKDLPYIALGDSDAMEIGEWVVAIGSPFQLEASLTVGVVSAKGRQNLKITDLEDFIQTDAAINPGNSGGPLLNLDSEVIGINTAIVSRTGGYMGIGFAVPSNMAKHVMAQIIDKGSVTRGFLGVSLQPVDKDIADAFNLAKPEGALVSEVVKDSPADKAGIQQGDIIIEYNNSPVKTLGSFRNDVSLMTPGSKVNLKVNRKGKIITIQVTLGSASDSFSTDGAMQKMGLEVDNLTPELAKQLGYTKGEEGVVITKIKPGSPAAVAGMRPGFLVMAINHKKVTNLDDFNDAMKDSENKKRVLILARQGNITRFYSLKME
ncbi:MAG TPA: DegQ family serine endoprotease [Rhabdochlamydiaceae bacterium]|nr:DegQ family serine endoprotease [Rhabdochlamydiaceae bacterium]